MITLIHGEDTASSRNYYFDLRKHADNAKTVDGSTITVTDLQQAVSGTDLFGDVPLLFIDELFSKRKAQKEIESIAEILNSSSAQIILYESKELTPKQISLLQKPIVKQFKIPSTVFALMDMFTPHAGKKLVDLFHIVLKDKDAEFVLAMLERQVRLLFAFKESSKEQISEISRLAVWQKGKLEKQSHLFDTRQLVAIHQKLFNMDLGLKTGGLSQPLADEIDLLLLSV